MLFPGVIGLIPLGVCLGLILLISVELAWVQAHDGQMLRRLRSVFASLFFLLAFPFTAGVVNIFHTHPFDEQMVESLDKLIWIARSVLATALTGFWLALHRWGIRKYQEQRQRERS